MRKQVLLDDLRRQKIQLNEAAEALFADDRFETRTRSELIAIAIVSVADLGFDLGTTYRELTVRALESGLTECPLELGPSLRMQFLDQLEAPEHVPAVRGKAPPGSITVASCPLDESDETSKGFYLRHSDGVLWLRGYRSWAGHTWSPDDIFVFARAP